MATLKDLFTSNCKPVITNKQLQDLEKFTTSYEVRDDNPMAFNTPLLAVHRSYWFPRDADYVFAIFGIDKNTFIQDIKQCPAVNKNFNVTSNEFNILIMWLIYCLKSNTSITKPVSYAACMNLLKLLHYKFFCGKVAQQFQYGAKESVMMYTLDNLTAKSDIKDPDTDTWKKLIYKHCEVTLEPNTIYTQTFNQFSPDASVIKSISDIHTRLCRKIVLISEAYYENNKKGLSYTTSNIMIDDQESGLKKIGDLKGTLDIAINRICTAALNINEFVDNTLVNLTVKLTSNIRRDNVMDVLTLFSSMATQQVKDKTTTQVTVDKNKDPLYVGYVTLVEELIQKTYRRAALMGVDVTSNIGVLNAAKNTYTASRVIDKEILVVKNSIDFFMSKTKYTRQGTLVSLRLALILYLIMLSFKYK